MNDYKPSEELMSKASEMFPQESPEQLVNGILKIKSVLPPDAKDEDILNHAADLKSKLQPSVPVEQPLDVRTQVLDKYSQQARENLLAKQKEESSGPAWAAGIAALGAGLAGKDAASAGQGILSMQQKGRERELEQFDVGAGLQKQSKLDVQATEKARRESDPNSEESKTVQMLAQKYMPNTDFSKSSASFLLNKLPFLEKAYAVDVSSKDKKEAAEARKEELGMRREEMGLRRQEVGVEKLSKLSTPFGTANTETDAKKLKDAYEEKSNFDGKLEEMIRLRQKHGGGAVLNREDVARGKQLSKDLLLSYKNMAKLGVLSQADEDIINAIIPPDPLSYNSPIAAIQGQDPVLRKLTEFKKDSDKDFATKVQTRIRGGQPEALKRPQEQVKQIGAKSYRKVAGGWEEV